MSGEKRFYAHSLEGQPEENWQLWADHSQSVATAAALFAAILNSPLWAFAAGWLHDLGKRHPLFQAYLLRENGLDASEWDDAGSGRVNHSGAGAIFAIQKWPGIAGKALAYIIAGHHAGLPDWNIPPTDHGAGGTLCVRLETEKETAARIDSAAASGLENLDALPATLQPPPYLKSNGFHLWVRMLFSCLVDADYLDTERFMSPDRAANRPAFPSLSELKTRFDTSMAAMVAKAPATALNQLRQQILTDCRRMAAQKPGLFSLTVPTGGGKTLSGTAFALEHAVAHGKRRIIYVIPYTSIIEQTANVLRSFFGDDNVLEHHSNLDTEKADIRLALAAENWDAPVIVTTNVQFFESLYAAKTSRCRKLHNIAESVVILDEAQMLPPEWLHPCVEVLNHLTEDYGVSVVLSTATQPALPGLRAMPQEIVSDPGLLYRSLKRTNIVRPADLKTPLDWPSLATRLCAHEQVLCIVNRRRDCLELYREMPPGTIHLSASMCGAHRSKVIAEIKKRLGAKEPVRVISTQLVEAGVDIDFPVVYRALAGLDSIAQAAGRCNREGRLDGMGEVHLFVPPKPSPRGLLLKGENAARELLETIDFDTPEAFERYFQLFYASVNDMGHKWLHEHLTRDVPHVQFRTAGETFSLIGKDSTSIVVRYDTSEQWLEEIRSEGPSRELLRRLQRYTISVPALQATQMLANGLIEEVHPGLLAQTLPSLYTEETGFDIFSEALPSTDLVF